MQKEYLGDWTIFEGIVLTENRKLSYLDNVRDCLEKEHLFEIAAMLKREGFIPEEFWLIEYPVKGVYFFERIIQNRKIVKQRGIDFFCISCDDGILRPHFQTVEADVESGYNDFPCDSIKESIKKMEC